MKYLRVTDTKTNQIGHIVTDGPINPALSYIVIMPGEPGRSGKRVKTSGKTLIASPIDPVFLKNAIASALKRLTA